MLYKSCIQKNGGAHDHRQQGAKEDDLRRERHVLDDQGGQNQLRVLFDQALDHGGVDDLRGVGEKQRHRGEEEIRHAAERRAPHRDDCHHERKNCRA